MEEARSRGVRGGRGVGLIRRAGDQRGVAVVELAIILPAFLLILLGVMDFGKVLYYFQAATQTAATGARQGAVDRWPGSGSGTTLQQWVRNELRTKELRQKARVCVSLPTGTKPGNQIEVKVQIPQGIPILSAFTGGDDLVARGSATMRIEVDSAGTSGVTISSASDINPPCD